MIFVTVGTHEQQFNRLIKYIDDLKKEGFIEEDVIMQIGYSTYKPKYCKWKNLFPYQEMIKFVNDARIVITHGGPSSFIMPLQVGKTPIVVPRQKQFGEHVNNHQLEFVSQVFYRMNNIVMVENISDLTNVINNYDSIIKETNTDSNSNNCNFIFNFINIVNELMK